MLQDFYNQISLIDNQINILKKIYSQALHKLDHELKRNEQFFKKVTLSPTENVLTFELFSMKLKIMCGTTVSTDYKEISHAIISTTIFNNEVDKYENMYKYEIMFDKFGNFNKEYTVDEFVVHYFDHVIMNLFRQKMYIAL